MINMASSAAASSASVITMDLHEYLKEKNLSELFVSIVESVLRCKPENPVEYITRHLLEKFPGETQEISNRLTRREETLPSIVAADKIDADVSSDTSSDCSSVIIDESVAPSARHGASLGSERPPVRKKRRESVCAEKIADCVVDDSELRVTEKSPNEAARISEMLRSNVFFSHLDGHQMQTIQNVMFGVEKSDGDIIISQGDDGDNFYIVDSGSVEVFIDVGDACEKKVKTCAAGESFGELAIMYNAPRAASCIAKGHVRLWALDRVSFNVVLRKTTIRKRTRMRDILLKIPVFAQLTEYQLLTLADTLQEETFESGVIVCNQGDKGDKFYLVNKGTAVCTITRNDGSRAEVARLSAGSYFGEVSAKLHVFGLLHQGHGNTHRSNTSESHFRLLY